MKDSQAGRKKQTDNQVIRQMDRRDIRTYKLADKTTKQADKKVGQTCKQDRQVSKQTRQRDKKARQDRQINK